MKINKKKIKKFLKEIIILILQLFMFYIFPMFAGPTDAMGMVVLMIFATFLLSLSLGLLSGKNLKYAYSVVIALLFIPTNWIYYTGGALIHSIWYLVISMVGLFVGSVARIMIRKTVRKKKRNEVQ